MVSSIDLLSALFLLGTETKIKLSVCRNHSSMLLKFNNLYLI